MSKAVFYTFGGSVWAAVPELALVELGYTPDLVEKKVVNLVEGENFDPAFLKINPNATLPTLTADGKAYISTIEVISYLVANAPKPAGKASGTDLVKRIHEDDIDPNFALLLARSEAELKARGAGIALAFLANRQASLEKHAPTPAAVEYSSFYKEKIAGNGALLAIYQDKVGADSKGAFFEKSKQHWASLKKFIVSELPAYLPDSGFIGGDKPGEDDFHVGGWLARIVATVGGSDISALTGPEELNQAIPPKVEAYWKLWSGRESWKTVYADGLH